MATQTTGELTRAGLLTGDVFPVCGAKRHPTTGQSLLGMLGAVAAQRNTGQAARICATFDQTDHGILMPLPALVVRLAEPASLMFASTPFHTAHIARLAAEVG